MSPEDILSFYKVCHIVAPIHTMQAGTFKAPVSDSISHHCFCGKWVCSAIAEWELPGDIVVAMGQTTWSHMVTILMIYPNYVNFNAKDIKC